MAKSSTMQTDRPSLLLSPSASLAEARDAFLADLGDWVRECLRALQDEPATDIHDQGTFTLAWEPYIRATGDAAELAFMKTLRDRMREHMVATDQWHHGYWRMNEAHHGTEHFELFLGALWRLDPADAQTQQDLLDAAEHLGNWVPDVPAWFDWETGLYRGFFFGADGLGGQPGDDVNRPDHLRCVNVALLAHAMCGDGRYLTLATTHAGRWADAVLDGDALPVALAPAGPCYGATNEGDAAYRARCGVVGVLDDDVDRTENFLASGAVQGFLRLWHLTDDQRFRRAAERLCDVLATQLPDPDAGPAAHAIRIYRNATGDTRYDAAVIAAGHAAGPVREVSMEPFIERRTRPRGIGKRNDMPNWYYDGAPRTWNAITAGLAAEITGDTTRAAWALDVARAHFALARRVYPTGREHGCSAQTVNAIASGHGRDNSSGMVTAVLAPMLSAVAAPR